MDLFKLLGTIAINNTKAIEAITSTTDKAEQMRQDMSQKFTSIGEKSTQLGQKFMAMSAVCGGALVGMVKYASDYEESSNKVDVAFGKSSKTVHKWAQSALQNFGIAEGTALDLAATFGDMSTSMGLSSDEAAAMSTNMVGLAGDLASFKNIGIDQAYTALNGVFTGETESLKSLGVVMTQTNLDAFALANGFGKTTKEMSQAELVNLRYQYVLDKTKNAQGDFARTGDGTANQMRKFRESIKEVAASFGQALLPITAKVFGALNKLLEKVNSMPSGMKVFVVALLGVGAAIAPVLLGFGQFMKVLGLVTKNWGAFLGILKKGITVMTGMNPVILIIGALAAAFVLLYKHSKEFRKAVNELGSEIKAVLQPAFKSLKAIFEQAKPVLKDLFNTFGSLAKTIGSALAPVIKALTPLIAKAFGLMANVVKRNIKTIVVAVKALTAVMKLINKYLVKPIVQAAKKISESIKKIKNAFKNLKIKFPKFKLPELYIKWGKSNNIAKALGLKGMPKIAVKWHAKGAVFNRPTLLQSASGVAHGVSEAGAEAVTPITVLKDYVSEAVAGQMASMLACLKEIEAARAYTFNLATVVDGRQIAISTAKYTQEQLNKLQQRQDRMAGVRA